MKKGETIGLKVQASVPAAKCISVIRKYDPSPMSVIRDRILRHEYLLVYSYTDRFALKKLIKCYKDLAAQGIEAELYELDDDPTTIDLLENLNRTYDEISDQIDAEMMLE